MWAFSCPHGALEESGLTLFSLGLTVVALSVR